jgi:anti-anti-sigma regulatory factor
MAFWGLWNFFSLDDRIAEIAAGMSQSPQLVDAIKEIQNMTTDVGWVFLISSLIIATLGAVAVLGVSYYVYRKTRMISRSFLDATYAIEQGKEEVFIDTGGYEETKNIARAIQEMALKIGRQAEALRSTIDELSIPAIDIWRGVVFMPIVGYVDSKRALQIEESLLSKVSETKARFVILDISGVSSIDTQVMAHIIKIIKEMSLLGAKAILSGTSPQTARSLVHLGIDLGTIEAYAELEGALRRIFTAYGFSREKSFLTAAPH